MLHSKKNLIGSCRYSGSVESVWLQTGQKSSTWQSEEDDEEADPEDDAADDDREALADEEDKEIYRMRPFAAALFAGFADFAVLEALLLFSS